MAATIGRCGDADIADVIRFIDEHWMRGHALVANRRLLDWLYRHPDGGYSFVVARVAGAIAGVLGFIPTRRFDPALRDSNVVWLTIWKVRDDARVAGLGLALLQRVTESEPHVAVGAIGFNLATRPIYQALGYQIGELQHYVLPNSVRQRFELASLIPSTTDVRRDDALPLTGTDLQREEDFTRVASGWPPPIIGVPRKTPRYFYSRYVCHPIYSYRVVALMEDQQVRGLLASRVATHAGRRALRLVDVLGAEDVVGRIGPVVQSLMRDHDAEYADIYNIGVPEHAFQRSGFRRIDPNGSEIVPDHFEPFERKNVRLWFSLKGGARDLVLFKGDADQDRPNLVLEKQR